MKKFEPKKGNPCILYDKVCDECRECMMCDLDPKKECDNCGKCLEEFMPKTDEKGFVEIPVDFEKEVEASFDDLLSAYGLDDHGDEE